MAVFEETVKIGEVDEGTSCKCCWRLGATSIWHVLLFGWPTDLQSYAKLGRIVVAPRRTGFFRCYVFFVLLFGVTRSLKCQFISWSLSRRFYFSCCFSSLTMLGQMCCNVCYLWWLFVVDSVADLGSLENSPTFGFTVVHIQISSTYIQTSRK